MVICRYLGCDVGRDWADAGPTRMTNRDRTPSTQRVLRIGWTPFKAGGVDERRRREGGPPASLWPARPGVKADGAIHAILPQWTGRRFSPYFVPSRLWVWSTC